MITQNTKQNMTLLITFLILLASSATFGKNYYFSSTSGDDLRNNTQAQSQSTPWKSIGKLNTIFASLLPGDSILFKRGDIFYGSIYVNKSGTSVLPIVLGAYGIGAKPVITGFQTITGWTNLGSNKWESAVTECNSTLNMVTVNKKNTPRGRYPNTGYLIFESAIANSSITDSQLNNSPNWTGAEVVIRKRAWVLDRNKVTSHSGNTISYISGSTIEPKANYGYFFQNDPKTLDLQGEWYLNPTSKKLLMYFNSTPGSSIIKASCIDKLFVISGFKYITVINLSFEGANNAGIDLTSAKYINIRNCNIEYSGLIAIKAVGNSDFLSIDNCSINQTNDVAIQILSGSDHASLTNNTIKNSGMLAGMGGNGTSTYSAITLEAANTFIEYNNIDSTGYVVINYRNNNTTIRKNFINYYCSVLEDGGAIYTSLNTIGSDVSDNIILNGVGAKVGTPSVDPLSGVAGIYLDDQTANVRISNNTIANVSRSIYIHNTHEVKVSDNTLYNNGVGIYFVHDNYAPNDPIRNVTLKNNILVPKTLDQVPLGFNSRLADIHLFGSADNNYFIRSVGNDFLGKTIFIDNAKKIQDAYSIKKWKSKIDAKSKASPIPMLSYKINSLGPNKVTNGNFTTSISGTNKYYSGTAALNWDNTGELDGGSAKLSYSVISTTDNRANFMVNLGSMNLGEKYIVRFSTLGTKAESVASVRFYGGSSPWPAISKTQYIGYSNTRTNHELLFTADATVTAGTLYIVFSDLDGTVFVDNVEVFEANVTEINPDDILFFDYNASKEVKNVVLPGTYVDVKGISYNNSIDLQPYTSAVLFKTSNSNNQAPVIRNQNFQLNENAANSFAVGTVLATDPNKGQSKIFSIVSGNTNGAFTINASTGVITVANSAALNFELTPTFALLVKVQDNGTPSLSSQATITVALLNVNEPPAITNQIFTTIANSANGTVVGSVIASDPDAGQTTTFSIVSGNTNNAFQINATTGVLTVATSLALNYLTMPSFSLVVKVQDNGTINLSSQAAVTVNLTSSIVCSATGNISYQVWDNLGSSSLVSSLTSNINYPENPSSTTLITSMEGTTNLAEGYGARIVGYICAPSTGSYTFWIASDDNGELWLSTDDQPANIREIAYNDSYTGVRVWNKYATQKSVAINLVQGQKYYIEALMKESTGGDNLAVGWLKPGETGIVPSEVIPGSVLSPISIACSAVGNISYEIWNNIGSGKLISDLTTNVNYPNNPTSRVLITSMEGTTNFADGFGARIAGYICAPSTGNYTFWLASDDYGELWLSTDSEPGNKQKIAYVNGYTWIREWNKYSSQKSVTINLIQGQKYYIEAIMKEAAGYDNLAVGWLKPGQTGIVPSEIIPGSVLSPLVTTKSKQVTSDFTSSSPSDISLLVYPNPLNSDVLNVKVENILTEATIQIFSISGILCYEELVSNSGTIHIDRSVFKSGIYIVKAFNTDFVKSTKLIVK